KGYLKLALVSCPIALYSAASSSERHDSVVLMGENNTRLIVGKATQGGCHGEHGIKSSFFLWDELRSMRE
ncbi:MAG: hypothetical protein WBG15_12450, partial [Xanthobacteraceae bacterium]